MNLKSEWYRKFLAKLEKIKSGELSLDVYMLEVQEKINSKELEEENDKLTECRNCLEKVEMISTGEICPNCNC
ncbi:hypothetical protein [Belliella pelovolcani]|uniref:hypothetical protein n=1 Tax=Belliella pelovolcani TaxID=529505 RepID=UPI0039199B33